MPSLDVAAPAHGKGSRPLVIWFKRTWPYLRFVVAITVIALVLWELSSHQDELSGLTTVFDHLHWWWIPPALISEGCSFVCFTSLQRGFLKSGGLRTPVGPMLEMVTATQAIANSLPGGNAVAAVYGFRWYRRFGADDSLAAWSLAGAVVATAVALSLLAVGGLALATGEGASLDLIPPLIGVLVVTIAIGALFVYERPLVVVTTWIMRFTRKLVGRPRGDMAANIDRIVRRVTAVRLGTRQIGTLMAWALGNWLFDCSCFAMMFLAVNATIPWKGLLLAYGAGQLAATLPITPGGLGVVEGSITIALVAFGGAQTATVDAVLLYRLISFWLVLLVGWGLWGHLAYQVRRGYWSRSALETPVEAGLDADPSSTSGAELCSGDVSTAVGYEIGRDPCGERRPTGDGRHRGMSTDGRPARRLHLGTQQSGNIRQLLLSGAAHSH